VHSEAPRTGRDVVPAWFFGVVELACELGQLAFSITQERVVRLWRGCTAMSQTSLPSKHLVATLTFSRFTASSKVGRPRLERGNNSIFVAGRFTTT
jgi:hypothetical protein